MPTLPSGQPDAAVAAAELRQAAETIERRAPPGFTKDVADVLRRIGLMVSALTKHDTTDTCRRCGQPFTFAAWKFAAKNLTPPQHCFACREARRAERARAGIPRDIAVPPPD